MNAIGATRTLPSSPGEAGSLCSTRQFHRRGPHRCDGARHDGRIPQRERVNVAVPAIGRDLGACVATLQWTLTNTALIGATFDIDGRQQVVAG